MKPPHLIIIGGVASGPAAAAEARRTAPDLRITLIEAGEYISYSACEMPHLLSGRLAAAERLVRHTPDAFATKYGIDVKTKHTATHIDAEKRTVDIQKDGSTSTSTLRYDRLILATGALATVPEAMRLSSPSVFVLRTLEDVKLIHKALQHDIKHAVVIGSGYVGLDAAWALHLRGIRTTILSPSGFLGENLSPGMNLHVAAYLRSKGIHIRQERASGIEKARDGKIIAVLTEKGEKIGCDFALVATGTTPRTELARQAGIRIGTSGGVLIDHHMRTHVNGIWACGDCTERKEMVYGESIRLPLSLQAFRGGRVAGHNAARGGIGRPDTMPLAVHAAAIGLGELEVAHTGWTKEAASGRGKNVVSAGATHRTASSLSPHHIIHIELVAESKTGRLVGGQIVGGPGSAGRINVITSVIRAGGTVDDLYNIDFIYAPTLAPAHDPLFVTARLLQKQL